MLYDIQYNVNVPSNLVGFNYISTTVTYTSITYLLNLNSMIHFCTLCYTILSGDDLSTTSTICLPNNNSEFETQTLIKNKMMTIYFRNLIIAVRESYW